MTPHDQADTLLHFAEVALQIAALPSIALGLYYTFLQTKTSKEIHADTLKWNKKIATENELAIKPKNIAKLNNAFNIRGDYRMISTDEINNKYKEKDEYKSILNNITHVLNKYDRIARGIRNDIYIEDIVRDSSKHTFFKTYNNFYLHIKARQKVKPSQWIDFTNLVEKWFPNARHVDLQILNQSLLNFFDKSEIFVSRVFSFKYEDWYLLNYKDSKNIKNKIINSRKVSFSIEKYVVIAENHFNSFLLITDQTNNTKIHILNINDMTLKETELEISGITL